jgi:LytS/YehU family sensor histidine kinase
MFWLILYIILISLDKKELGIVFTMSKEFITVGFFALLVYINFFYLFPQYISTKSLFWHIISLAATAAVLTPIKSFILYFIYFAYPEQKTYILNNQVFFFLSFFFMGIGSTIYYIMGEWLKGQRHTSELHNKTLQSELKFLKSQINPHFLFNTLNNLYALTLKKSDLAPEIVLKLSEMMRYMLYECNERMVPLSKEVNYIKNYLELEKLRQGKKVNIKFKMEGEIENQKIAPLMFIPFLENSFKHGLNNQISEGFVDIELKVKEGSVEVEIENSKAPSMPSASGKKSGGIGLVNVRRRLDLLYPDSYELDIENNPNTYHVKLKLKLD